MSLVTIVYLAGIVEGLAKILVVIGFLGLFISLIVMVVCQVEGVKGGVIKAAKFCVGFTIILLLSALIPNKDTIYLMLAAHGVEEVASNERVQNIAGKSLEALEKAIGDYLEEPKE